MKGDSPYKIRDDSTNAEAYVKSELTVRGKMTWKQVFLPSFPDTQKRLVVDSTIDSVARTNFTTVHIFTPHRIRGLYKKMQPFFTDFVKDHIRFSRTTY